jgi:hypothetical protein
MKLNYGWRRVTRDQCYSGGCPDQLYAGGIEWTEACRRKGVVLTRTCWATAGRTLCGQSREATPEEVAAIAARDPVDGISD